MRPFLVVSNLLVWVLLPSAWLVGAWALGPHVPGLTPLVLPLAMLGMGGSMLVSGRYLIRWAANRGLADPPRSIRWRTAHPARRRVEVAKPRQTQRLSLRAHVLAGLVFASMILVALGVVTVMPLGVIWVASQLSSTTVPGTFPYLLVALGIALGAVISTRLLAALQRWHSMITGRAIESRRTSAWLRSLSDTDWERDPGAVVEWLMVIAVVVGVVAVAVWLMVFADPSRLVPQELQAR